MSMAASLGVVVDRKRMNIHQVKPCNHDDIFHSTSSQDSAAVFSSFHMDGYFARLAPSCTRLRSVRPTVFTLQCNCETRFMNASFRTTSSFIRNVNHFLYYLGLLFACESMFTQCELLLEAYLAARERMVARYLWQIKSFKHP